MAGSSVLKVRQGDCILKALPSKEMKKDDLIYFSYIKIHCNNLQPFLPRQHYPEIQKEIKKNGQIGGLSDCTEVAPEKVIIS